jgi:hypothetical protein
MPSQCIDQEKERFESAPGSTLQLANPRLETGAAASSTSLYLRARDLTRINSVLQGKDVMYLMRINSVRAAAPAAPLSFNAVVPRRATAAVLPPVAAVPAVCAAVGSIAAADVHGVDSIYDVKIVNLKLHYFVKWTGYDVSNNTWEPEDHIMDPALITAFKIKFPSAHRDAVAEIAKRKLEKTRKTSVSEVPAPNQHDREVTLSRMGRQIVAPVRD